MSVYYKVLDPYGNVTRTGLRNDNAGIINLAPGERLFELNSYAGYWDEVAAPPTPALGDAEERELMDADAALRFLRPASGPHSEAARESILAEATRAVYGARETAYGHPRDDFARIAALWTAYLQAKPIEPLTRADVACMMGLLKMTRLMETPMHRDSWVDLAGYAAAGARAVGLDA